MHEDIQTIGLKFAKTKQQSTTLISHNLMEVSVHANSERYLTPQIASHDSFNTDDDVHEKPTGPSPDKDVERGE